MSMDDNDGDSPSVAEQGAFSDTHALIRRLVDIDGYSAAEVGSGVLIAALSILRTAMLETEVAKLLYGYADDYATRHLGR